MILSFYEENSLQLNFVSFVGIMSQSGFFYWWFKFNGEIRYFLKWILAYIGNQYKNF